VSLDSALAILLLASSLMAVQTADESIDADSACGRVLPLRE
jgi:hypothetical protein